MPLPAGERGQTEERESRSREIRVDTDLHHKENSSINDGEKTTNSRGTKNGG